jgi:hypothetical protein
MTAGILAGRLKPVHAWRELAAFLFLPADVIWMTGWFCLLTEGQATPQIGEIYLTLVLVNVLAYLILRVLFAWKAPVVLRLTLAGLGLLSVAWLGESLLVYQGLIFDFNRILLDIWTSFSGARGLSIEFWSLACGIYLWVRAIVYTRSPVTQDTIMSRLQFGIFMFLILVLIYTGLNLAVMIAGLCLLLILGLTSLGLSRIADINLHRGGKRLQFSWDWLMVLTGVSTSLVMIAGLISLLTGTWLSLGVIALTGGILTIIRFIVVQLIVPLVNVLLAILYSIIKIFYNPDQQVEVEPPELELLDPFRDFEPFKLADPTAEGLKAAQPYLLGILLGLAAVIILVMLLRLPRRENLGDVDDAGEKNGGNALKLLRKAISRSLQNALDQFSKQVNLRRVTGMFRAARIRWIYQQFELLAARRGYPRLAAVTPLEFQSIVTQYFIGGAEDIALLTSAYQSVRYGELPETAAEVTRVVHAWDRLKKLKVVRQARPEQHQMQ